MNILKKPLSVHSMPYIVSENQFHVLIDSIDSSQSSKKEIQITELRIINE